MTCVGAGPPLYRGDLAMPPARGRRKPSKNREPGDLPQPSESFVDKEGFFGFMSKESLLIFFFNRCEFIFVNGGFYEIIIGNATKN